MPPYELRWSRTARRAISHGLAEQLAAAAVELITGPIADNPWRVGKALRAELAGVHSARLGQRWRVLYEIDEPSHTVTVLDIQHRAASHHRR